MTEGLKKTINKIQTYFVVYIKSFLLKNTSRVGWALLTIYSVLFLKLLKDWSYSLNPDGHAYLALASKPFLTGQYNILDSVTGTWSPLFTFLVYVVVLIGFQGIIAAKIANFIAGVLCLIAAYKLFCIYIKNKLLVYAILIPLSFQILRSTLTVVSSDLLYAGVTIFYLTSLASIKYSESKFYPYFVGFLGGLSYLVRGYGLYFFCASFFAVNIYQMLFLDNKKRTVFAAIKGFLAFSAICLFWVAVLHAKYGTLTLGYSGKYNTIYSGAPLSPDTPLVANGLVAPTMSNSYFAWEDPSVFVIHKSVPAVNIKQVAKRVIVNTISLNSNLLSYLPFWYVGVGAFLWFIHAYSQKDQRLQLIQLTLVLFIYPLGYLLFFIRPRFLILMLILLVLMSSLVFEFFIDNAVVKQRYIGKIFIAVLAYLTMFLWIFLPVSDFDGKGLNRDIYKFALKQASTHPDLYLPNSSYASSKNYFGTFDIIYFWGGKYFGQFNSRTPKEQIDEGLRINNIDYYVLWLDKSGNQYVPFNYEKTAETDYFAVYKRISQ